MYCLTHRLPEQHFCTVILKKKVEDDLVRAQELALQVERQNLVSETLAKVATQTTGKTGVKPVKKKKLTDVQRKRAAKVRVMKLKGSAKGPSYIPQADRIYFEIEFNSTESKSVFVDQNYSVGRAISSIKTTLAKDIENLSTESDFPLDVNKELRELLELGILINGDKLYAN